MQETPTVGLREQKRLETRHNIEDSATRLVDERGFNAVTVEEICEDAGISRRTFFNYFNSKDEAVLGTSVTPFNEEQRALIVNTPTDNVVALILDIVAEHFARHQKKGDIWQRRQRIANDPNAAAALMAKRRANSTDVVNLLLEHFEANPQDRRLPNVDVDTEAALISSILRETFWISVSCRPCAEDNPLAASRLKASAQLITDFSKGLTW